jgi:hypothetical protein
MVDRRTSIYFGERGQRLPMTLLIEGKVALDRLLDDPAPRSLETLGEAVKLTGELIRNVGGYDAIAHVNHSESD